jgi:hypothetical protein
VVTGKVTTLVGSMAEVDLRFVVVGHTVLVRRPSLDSATTIIPELAAFDLPSGVERWRRTFPPPPGPPPAPAVRVEPPMPPPQ